MLKAAGMALTFVQVPLAIRYLGLEKYGIWVTLLSIISWFSFFDFGLSNGLRNKVAECLGIGDFRRARELISSAYAFISLMVLVLVVCMTAAIGLLNWQVIFNVQSLGNGELRMLVTIVSVFLVSNFIVGIGNQLFYSVQRASFVSLAAFLTQLLTVVGIQVLIAATSRNILLLGMVYGISLLLPGVCLTGWFFVREVRLRPSVGLVSHRHLRTILGTGLQFFFIQVGGVMIFTTGNIVLTQVLGPESVSQYNVVGKVFNIFTTGFSILLIPYWSAFTDAFVKNDTPWIRRVLLKLNLLFVPTVVLIIAVLMNIDRIVELWVGKGFACDPALGLWMAAYTIVSVWNSIYATFINGTGRIKMEMVAAVFGGLLNIPLSVFLVRNMGMGVAGIPASACISLLMFAVLAPIQTVRMTRTA